MSEAVLRRQQEDIAFLKNPRRWIALGGFGCPVKRYPKPSTGNGPDCGIVFSDNLLKVHEANMFGLPETLEGCPVHEYESIEALVADGWMVD